MTTKACSVTNAVSVPIVDLAGLLGTTIEAATARLGAATSKRVLGEDLWILYQSPDWSLRIRARSSARGEPARVRSWTIAFEAAYATLAAACEAVGIAPPSGSEATRLVEGSGRSMLRRALRDDHSKAVHSLTAALHLGRVRSLTVFDEAPDWEPEADPA